MIFTRIAPVGRFGVLGVAQLKKLHDRKSHHYLIMAGGPIMEIFRFHNFGFPLASPAFRPCFLGPWTENKKYQINIFCLVLLTLKRFAPQIRGVDWFGAKPNFCGPRLTLRVPGSKSPAQKLLVRGWGITEYFRQICCYGQKLGSFCTGTPLTRGHTDTHWQTFSYHVCTTKVVNLFMPICEGVYVEQWFLQNFYHFTSWRTTGRMGASKR